MTGDHATSRRRFLATSAAATGALAASRRGEAGPAPSGRPVRVGMAQILVRTGAVPENLARACDSVARAKAEGCAVVVLPECLDLGWTHPDAPRLAKPIPGPIDVPVEG